MSEAMDAKLQELFESLSDEQQEGIEACGSLDELVEFADKEGIGLTEEMVAYLREQDSELSLDDLDAAAGGGRGGRGISAHSLLNRLAFRNKLTGGLS